MAPDISREAQQAITLIKSFSLELDQYSPESQVLSWLSTYRAHWIRDAIIEAVYQGRYKVVSVQQILTIWKRRGQPVCHFTSGFEQVIAEQLGEAVHLGAHTLDYPSSEHTLQSKTQSQKTVSTLDPFTLKELNTANFVTSAGTAATRQGASFIDVFPVDAVDTLVAEIHQTSVAAQTPIVPPTRTAASQPPLAQASTGRLTSRYPQHYSRQTKSLPIQPFQPAGQGV